MLSELHVRDGVMWQPPEVKVEKYSQDQVEFSKARLLEESRWLSRAGWRARRLLRQHAGSPPGQVLSRYCARPEEGTVHSVGNSLLYMGMNKIDNWLIGTGSQAAMGTGGPGSTHGYVGVGDSTTVPTPGTDTAMLAATNHCYNAIDVSFPTIGTGASTGILTVQSTFAPAAAVFQWNEWGTGTSTAAVPAATTPTNAQGTVAPTGTLDGLINRAVVGGSLGTKGSGSAWVFTVTLRLQ